VICDVLCCKMTMYCCEDYGLSSFMSKLELSFYVLLLYVHVYPMTLILEAPHLGRQTKYDLYKKIQYVLRLTEEYSGHVSVTWGGTRPPVYSSVMCQR
jgi:hypothetical protein